MSTTSTMASATHPAGSAEPGRRGRSTPTTRRPRRPPTCGPARDCGVVSTSPAPAPPRWTPGHVAGDYLGELRMTHGQDEQLAPSHQPRHGPVPDEDPGDGISSLARAAHLRQCTATLLHRRRVDLAGVLDRRSQEVGERVEVVRRGGEWKPASWATARCLTASWPYSVRIAPAASASNWRRASLWASRSHASHRAKATPCAVALCSGCYSAKQKPPAPYPRCTCDRVVGPLTALHCVKLPDSLALRHPGDRGRRSRWRRRNRCRSAGCSGLLCPRT